ncbi:MAG: tripartite tricarboxylate transporter substrate-binding protein [Burkholderiales bacterium]
MKYLLILAALAPCLSFSQTYPTKSVRVIVPASPGGGLDIMARMLGQSLFTVWGQAVVVDNRPGAGVMLGVEVASKAAPDGYTALVVNANLASNAVMMQKLTVVNDLSAVTMLATLPNALSVPASSPAKTTSEFIALAKSSKLTFGTAGAGTLGHVFAEMLKLVTGADMTHVPYKGGGPVMVALTGAQVNAGVVSVASTVPHAKAGRVRMLAVTGTKRANVAPEIPTIAETVPGMALDGWIGLLVPKGTPRAVMAALSSSVQKVINDAGMRQRLADQGYDVQTSTPEEFAAIIKTDLAKYAKVIREANIRE